MKVSDLILILKKNVWNILGWSISLMIISLVVTTFFITPKYSSSIDVLVNQKTSNAEAQYTAQQTDLQAINTYKDVLKRPVILQPVLTEIREKYNYQGNIEDLQNQISIQNETNSQVLTVSVKGKNSYVVANIANIIGKVFSKKIKKIMKVDNVSIVSKATPNNEQVSPNKKLFSFGGLILGFFIGLAIAIIRYLFDTTVKNGDFLKDDLGLVSLGTVYHISTDQVSYHAVHLKNEKLRNEKHRRV